MSGVEVRPVAPLGLLSIGDQLVAYQGHHHGLLLDQTVTDALGGEAWAVRKHAAFEAARSLLTSLFTERGPMRADDKLALAAELFAAMGQGRLRFDVTAEGGAVHGERLHYGASFARQYGRITRNKSALDAFGAGYAAAATSLAFPSDWGLFDAEETSCVGRGDEGCTFALTRRPERGRRGVSVNRPAVERLAREIEKRGSRKLKPALPRRDDVEEVSLDSWDVKIIDPRAEPPESADPPGSREAARAEASMTRLLEEAPRPEPEVLRAFGVNVAVVPVSYIDQITFDTMHLVERRTPELFPIYAALCREAATMGAFHLLGGVIASPLWTGSGALGRDRSQIVHELAGIARALGWGAIEIGELLPGKKLVLRSRTAHENVYYAIRHGASMRKRLVFLQGLGIAMMQLSNDVDWSASEPIGPDVYAGIAAKGPRFTADETRSTARGDDVCEILIEAI